MLASNLTVVPWAIVAAALFALAGVIYARQKASRVAVLFCFMIVLVGIWFGGFAIMFATQNGRVAEMAARIGLGATGVCPGP